MVPTLTVSPKTYQKIIPSNLLSKYSCSPNVIIYIGTNFHFKSVDNSKSYNILHIYSIHPTTEKKIHTLTTLIFLWCKKEGPSWRSKFSGYNLSIIIVLNWKLSNRTSFLIHKRCTIPTHTYLLTTLRFLHNKLFILL